MNDSGVMTGKITAPAALLWRAAAVFIAAALLFAATPARAANEAPGAKDAPALDRLVAEAVQNNPALRAARLEWLRTKQEYPLARSYDDPMLSYTYPIEPIETRLGPQDHIISLSQKFPFPGKLGVKGEIAEKEAEIARLKYEKALRDVALGVQRSYYELFYLGKAASLAKEQAEVFDFFIKAEMSEYSVGRKDLNDVVDAQTRYARAEEDLVTFEDLKDAERTRLNTLLNRAPEAPLGEIPEPKVEKLGYSLDELYSRAVGNEEVEMAKTEIERSGLDKKLARYRYLPEFSLGVNYSVIGDAGTGVRDAGKDAASVTFGVSIPLWFGKNRAANEQARLKMEGSLEKRASIENDLRDRLKKIYVEAKTERRLVELYSGTLLPKAKELISIARIKYKNGEGGISGVFNAQTMWLGFSRAYYRAMANYLEKTAEMERMIGANYKERTGMERIGMNIPEVSR